MPSRVNMCECYLTYTEILHVGFYTRLMSRIGQNDLKVCLSANIIIHFQFESIGISVYSLPRA